MKQFLLPYAPGKDGKLKLFDKDFHYLARVRRAKTGDAVSVVLPGGEIAKANVAGITKEYVELVLADRERQTGEADAQRQIPPLFLFQALPKGAKMDSIVRQAVECGVTGIIPFEAAYSVKKLPGSDRSTPSNLRWQRIVREARQQSGTDAASFVSEPVQFNGLFAFLAEWQRVYAQNSAQNVTYIVLHTEGNRIPMHHAVKKDCAFAVLAVGPEGGFAQQEVQRFIEAGFLAVSLGNSILRTESAALAGLAALRLLLWERDSWKLANV